jgi:hypothetical protein
MGRETVVFVDCTTEDLKRLDPQVVSLATALQQAQKDGVAGLDPRDSMIVLQTSILALERAAEKFIKDKTTPRFHRSIGIAYRLMRSFRLKPDKQ